MKKLVGLLAFLCCLMLPLAVLAQAEPNAASAIQIQINWQQIVALLINSVLVVVAVQLVKAFLPQLPGGVKQVLALVAGPLLLAAQSALTSWLGYKIDLGPLIALFGGLSSGLAAMGLFDIGKRVGRSVAVPRRE